MGKLDDIHAKLLEASRLLDAAAREMRELDGKSRGMSSESVAKIGSAIAEVMLVRHRIYILRPDLMPGYLKDPSGDQDGDPGVNQDSDQDKRQGGRPDDEKDSEKKDGN